MARPWRASSAEMVMGGTTCSRLKWVKGHSPLALQAAAEVGHRLVGLAGGVVRDQRLAGGAVLHQLEGPEHAEAPHLAHARMALLHGAQRRPDHVGAERTGVLDHALLLEDVDARHRRRTGQHVARVGEATGVRPVAEDVGDRRG